MTTLRWQYITYGRGYLTFKSGNKLVLHCSIYFIYSISRISPGLQSNTLQIASKVSNLIPLAFPVFKMDRLTILKPTFSDSSVKDILRLASITSKLIIMGMLFK